MSRRAPIFSVFELWPPWLFYLPVALYWAVLSLRFRSIGLPTAANPAIEAGGLCGESKSAILRLLGPLGRAALAPYTTVKVGPKADARAAIEAAGLALPLVAKPDISCKGTGVRVVRDETALAEHLAAFPAGADIILQALVTLEREAGIFYMRRPGEPTGRIVSLTMKHFPAVTGDGRLTLEELVRRDPRAGRLAELYLRRHERDRARVLAPGERRRLVFVGNHCQGAVFEDGRRFVTPALTHAIDRIAREIPHFYFGRFDVRFTSLADLRCGIGFRIIEVNGAGSEATHIWDRRTRLSEAYRTLFEQTRALFEIGAVNRARGFAPLGAFRLLGLYLRQRSLMRRYPLGD